MSQLDGDLGRAEQSEPHPKRHLRIAPLNPMHEDEDEAEQLPAVFGGNETPQSRTLLQSRRLATREQVIDKRILIVLRHRSRAPVDERTTRRCLLRREISRIFLFIQRRILEPNSARRKSSRQRNQSWPEHMCTAVAAVAAAAE